jgi:phosphoribosylformylglycinamidine cyclo-ligase
LLYPHLSKLKGLAHITGGGFLENIPRVLPDGLDARIDLDAWTPPSLWGLIQEKGKISTEEMYRVFNMGIGIVAIVGKSDAADVQTSIPEATFLIGELIDGDRKVILS